MVTYSLNFCNGLKGISIMYGYLGSSEEPKEIKPGTPLHNVAIEEGRILNLWLNPGDADIPKNIKFLLEEKYTTPYGPGGNYASQVIRSYGIPPEPDEKNAIETPVWTIIWGSLSPHTPQERELPRPEVNVTLSGPE